MECLNANTTWEQYLVTVALEAFCVADLERSYENVRIIRGSLLFCTFSRVIMSLCLSRITTWPRSTSNLQASEMNA